MKKIVKLEKPQIQFNTVSWKVPDFTHTRCFLSGKMWFKDNKAEFQNFCTHISFQIILFAK